MPSMRRAGAWALALEQKDRCSMTVPYIFCQTTISSVQEREFK